MHISVPLNLDILKWAKETHDILSSAKLPESVKFYNIYGTDYDTPHTVWYFLTWKFLVLVSVLFLY